MLNDISDVNIGMVPGGGPTLPSKLSNFQTTGTPQTPATDRSGVRAAFRDTAANSPTSKQRRMLMTGSLEASDAAAKAVQKTPNRVSLDDMKAKIDSTDYINPERSPEMTICIMKMSNGFVLLGKSAPADPANFDAELGRKFSYEDCIRQLWPLEGYALREKLATNS